MKNTQKGFIVPLLIAIIAVLAIGGGVYYYQKNQQPTVSNQPNVSNVSVSGETWSEGVYKGSPLIISWDSSNLTKVSIDLLKSDGTINRNIATNIENKGKYEWMVEDIQAWRAGDSTSKILISSVDKNIKAESQSFKMSGVFPAENNVTNSNNYKSGSIKGVYKKADGNSWIDVTELGGNKISVKGQASWEGSGVNSGQVNSGVIDGVVILNGNNGVYSQNGCEINLTFVPSGLIAKDNNQCGGLNVSFTGNYTRFQDSSSGGSSQITTSPEINIKGWLYAPTNGPEWTLKEVTAGYNPNTDNDVYSGRNFNLVFNSNSKCFSWVVSQGKPTSKAQISCPTATKGFGEGGSGDRVRVSGVLISSTLTVSSVELVSTLPVDQW